MAKAKKLPSGSWRVNQYVGKDADGKRVYKSFTADSKKEAEFMAAEYALDKKRKQKPENLTLREAMDRYLEIKSNVLSPSTLNGYDIIRRNRFLDIQDIPLSRLNNTMIQSSVNIMSKTLKPKTIYNSVGFLSSVLNHFYPDFELKVTKAPIMPNQKDLIEPDILLLLIKGTNIELPILLAAWLSYRMSEVRGIKKSDIKDGYLTIVRAKLTLNGKDVLRDATKTLKSTRKHRVPDYILHLIEQLPADQEYLVPEKPITITKRFYRLLEKNNLPHMTFHDLRHLNASIMAMLDIPEKYALDRGGWSSPAVYRNIYSHTFNAGRVQVDDKIDNYITNLLVDGEMQHEMQHIEK